MVINISRIKNSVENPIVAIVSNVPNVIQKQKAKYCLIQKK